MSPIPVSKTKLIPPRRRDDLLVRRRLLEQLTDALDRRLILVSAPAGYGKTSLLIDLVRDSGMPCCWLALDELDRDPQRFAAYFIASLAKGFPKFGSQSRAVLIAMNSFEQDMERLLVTLINELIEKVDEHFVLILDDFHLVENVPIIQNFINRFIQLMDDNCHLVISSRVLTSLKDMARLVAGNQVSGLNYSDLAFQPEELQALLAQNRGLHISDDEAARLIRESEGWITGLQFSETGILQKGVKHSVLEGGTDLFDYLGQQVLDQQPPELREFVLRTSFMEEFDAALCEAVLGQFYAEPQDWQKWVKAIARNNLFALPVGEDGRWLRYHHLFRDFIREQFQRERMPEVAATLSRLEEAYESMGEWEQAHQICTQLNDADALAAMIERAGTFMIQHAHLTLEAWLKDLPAYMLRNRAGLLSIRGALACIKNELPESLAFLNDAERLFRAEGNDAGLALTISRRATAQRMLGNYTEALMDAEEVLSLAADVPERQALYAEALRTKGMTLFRLGQTRQAVTFLEDALDLYIRLKEEASIPVLLLETGMVYRAIGEFKQAQTAYEKALNIWRKVGNLYSQANVLNNLGVFYHSLGQYEKAALSFEEGLLCARRGSNARLDALISTGLGDLYAELGDVEAAHRNYQHALSVIQNMDDRFMLHYLALAQSHLAFLQRDVSSARAILAGMEDSIRKGNSSYENGLLHWLIGRIGLAEGNPLKALADFTQAEQDFKEGGRSSDASAVMVWRAAACCAHGNQQEAVQILNSLIESRNHTAHVVFSALHQSQAWLGSLRQHPTAGRALRDLFSQVDKLAAQIPAARRELRRQVQVISSTAAKLVIQAFGPALVSVDGTWLTISDWQTQSVRDLFFYLVSTSRAQTKEQIGETLWPEQYELPKLRLRFKNDLYRLRRAVGAETILYQDVYYTFNRSIDYEYDVEAFESFLSRARLAQNPHEQMREYQKAVDVVRGPYLNDVYAEWVIPERERLNQLHLTALVTLADLYQKHGQPAQAVAISQRAIDLDAGMEDAYQIAMQAHARLGDVASVTKAYHACRDAMKRLFNLPPSHETEELHRRLTK
jgi:LuxR family transcriptional regulator, maltose regulon positive regulatory protein